MKYCSDCNKDVETYSINSTDEKFILELCKECDKLLGHTNLKQPTSKPTRKAATVKKDDKTVVKKDINVLILPEAKKIEIPINVIYTEGCEVTMGKMKDGAVDYIFTSPPYNFNESMTIKNGVRIVKKLYKNFEDVNRTQQEYYEWQIALITEMLRVTKSHVFYNNQLVANNKIALLSAFF